MTDAERLIFAAAYVTYYNVDGNFGTTVGAVQQAVKMVDSLKTVLERPDANLSKHEDKILREFYEGFSENRPAL